MGESDVSLDLCLVTPVANQNAPTQPPKLDDLLRRLEGERHKLQVFKRELPFSLLLLDDVIFRLKQQGNDKGGFDDKNWFDYVVGSSFLKANEKSNFEAAQSCVTKDSNSEREIVFVGEKEELQRVGNTSKKRRRYWSSALHRRFMSALENLGGSDAATPKQIRELMKIDGLTNDEVKSHLQKHRLRLEKHGSSLKMNRCKP